jgi:hypothetical protein
MLSRFTPGVLGASLVLLFASKSFAQCTKDLDCKGDRVCEEGQCVAPKVAPQAPPASTAAAAPVAPLPAPSAAPARAAPAPAPKMQRHSTGMMAGGIVMVSLAPVALVVAGFSALGKGLCSIDNENSRSCDGYDTVTFGALITALGLVGAGVPLLVIGAQKEPVPPAGTATISPWVTPTAAGIGLRIDM